ncbi:type 1 glutamine amidotransferase-like domain-containing protein [bacterium]|nr:type 1 glutamine amidotransferase-like domain-containing protein [bacterium]
MKFLLTSAGLSNKTIKKAFFDLVGKAPEKIKVAFIPTASNIEAGDKWWVIKDLKTLQDMNIGQIDIVDISALPAKILHKRFSKADIIFCEGGNTFYLMKWIKKSKLSDFLPKLLETKVWIGVSAGSIVVGKKLSSFDNIFDENGKAYSNNLGLGYLNFCIKPHYLNPNFASAKKIRKMAESLETNIYAIDDQSAIVVNGGKIDVISEGQWNEFGENK